MNKTYVSHGILCRFLFLLEFGEDTDDGGVTTDDEGPPAPALTTTPTAVPPPPPAPLPSTRPTGGPFPKVATSAKVVSPLPVAQTAVPPPSTTVAAVAEAIPTTISTIRRPFFFTSTLIAEPTRTTTNGSDDADDDDDDALTTTTTTINPLPTVFSLSTSTTAASTPSNGRPSLSPTDAALPASSGPSLEPKTAIAAAVSMICISLFFGIIYCLFRFCPAVRNRWAVFKLKRKHERQKRMGLDDSPLPPPVLVVNGAGTQRQSTWATAGTAMRNIGIENGVMRELDEAHLRPPSYSSHWTASGASWVANGFRVPERLSQRMMRWSERSLRNRFPERETETGSSEGGGDLEADRLRPLGMNPYGMGEVSQMSKSTIPASASAMSGISGASGGSGRRSDDGSGAQGSSHSQAGFSTNARISDMSSLSAGTTTNAFRPPPLFKPPIGVARGSGTIP